jgi:hypothetical protein
VNIESYTNPLRNALTLPESLWASIEHFLRTYWTVDRPSEIDGRAWDILGDLATDLEYYEPNPEWRRESTSFYGDERAQAEIRSALQRLHDECGITTEPCASQAAAGNAVEAARLSSPFAEEIKPPRRM